MIKMVVYMQQQEEEIRVTQRLVTPLMEAI